SAAGKRGGAAQKPPRRAARGPAHPAAGQRTESSGPLSRSVASGGGRTRRWKPRPDPAPASLPVPREAGAGGPLLNSLRSSLCPSRFGSQGAPVVQSFLDLFFRSLLRRL